MNGRCNRYHVADFTTTTVTVVRYGPAPGYSGLGTQITTTTKNDLGQVAFVKDALDAGDPGNHTTSYTYDAVGDLLTTTDPLGNVIQNQYDTRGRKIKSIDPDMGTWTYISDSLGRLTSQTDAKSQTTTIVYDQLNRMTERDEPDMKSTWRYDTATNGIGKLAEADCVAGTSGDVCPGGNYARVYAYDTKGRQSKVTITVNGASYYSSQTYDTNTGKLATERAFSGYTTKNVYLTTYGYLSQIQDNTTGFVVWQAKARDAELHLIQSQSSGGVLTTDQSFDATSGRVQTISAGDDGDTQHEVANLGYGFDTVGNLIDRTDTNLSWQQESFCYDQLNRLTNFNFGSSCTGGQNGIGYDAIGNISNKGQVGVYTYNPSGSPSVRPHAVSSIDTPTGITVNGTNDPTYQYDLNGNMTSGANRTVSYTSFNMAKSVTSGANALALTYDPEHQRIQQCIPNCAASSATTFYFNDAAGGAMTELVTSGIHPSTWRTYIVADGKLVAERIVVGPSVSMRYFVLDHLGSIAVIADETGAVVTDGSGNETGRLSYDPWGAMRNADGTADPACAKMAQSPSTRGFTSQEEMPSVCLINYNARIYDPQIGRFMSADPSIEAPYNPQDLNRFSYVGNNPLSFTDPTGLCFLGCFWQSPIFAAIIAIAIAILVPVALSAAGWGVFGAAASFSSLNAVAAVAAGGALSGGVSAALTGGNILQGILFGGLQAVAMTALAPMLGGELATSLSVLGRNALTAGRLIAAGMIGGLMSSAQGGSFMSGFLAAGVGSLGGPLLGEPAGTISPQGVLVSAALGGASAALGGGKFQNGAITAAFAYVASNLAQQSSDDSAGDPTVELRYRLLGKADGSYYTHTYIVVTGPDGEQFYMGAFGTGDPSNDASALLSDQVGYDQWGKLHAVWGDFNEQVAGSDWLVKPLASQTVLQTTSVSMDDIESKLIAFGKEINAEDLDYHALTTNSNAFANQAVSVLGIARPTPPVWAPGYQTVLGH